MNLRKNIRNILTKFTNESLENKIKCPTIKLTQEIIDEVNKHETSEQLLRAGGISIKALDRAAYGFSYNDIKILMPGKLHIKWKEDWKNVKLEQERSGLSKEAYAKKINIAEPIDVSYEKGKFYVEDGHHRLFAAAVLKKQLNVELEIKDNPIKKLAPELSYDEFHRCIFNQIKSKEKYVYHGTSKGAANRIKREGVMRPGQASGSINAPLFFSNIEQYASTYASRKDSGGGALFRVKKTPEMKVNKEISKTGGYLEYYTFREIPVNEIEIKTKDGWRAIDEFSFINEIRNGVPETKIVYHGTSLKKVEEIKSKGLNAGSMGYQSAGWYMVSTDFASALFHATAEDGHQAPVFEFEVPVDNTKWEGHPYFWPPYERNSESKWFALKQPLPNKFIKKIHYVDYDNFIKQKNEGF